jgi:hypothetical protein
MLVIVFVGVTVAVIVTVVVRMAIAMVVTVRMIVIMGVIVTVAVRMPVIMGMIVAVRMIVVVATGLASRMVMSAACRSPRLSHLGKQLLHTFFEVGVRFRREVINYGYWLETYRFQRTQQCIGRLLTPRKLNEGSAGLKAYAVGI